MNSERFDRWYNAYGQAWSGQDIELLLSIFTDDATYMYTPFHPLMKGKEEIEAYTHKGAVNLQSDIHFSYEMLAVQEPYAIARAKADFLWNATGERIHFDGIYQVYLDDEGRCYRFDEWWHCDPILPEENAPGA